MKGVRTETIIRIFRYAVYLSILVMIFWITSNFGFVALEKGDTSVIGVSGYRRLLMEKFSDGEGEVERDGILVFAVRNAEERAIFRISRVKALPGDVVGEKGGCYTVNGEPLEATVSDRVHLEGEVPEGFFLLLNDDPFSPFPDSRRIGLIDRRWVVGRFLSEMPF